MKKLITAILLLYAAYSSGTTPVQIGSQTTTISNLPISSCWDYSFSEQIILQTEINTRGPITTLRFYFASGSYFNSDYWTIYMGHTEKTAFTSNTDWIPMDYCIEVYDGAITYPAAGNWMEIQLETPFPYNNLDNLVVAVHEYATGYYCYNYFGAYPGGSDRGIYVRSYDPIDPYSPPDATATTATLAQVQLEIDEEAPILWTDPSLLDFGYVAPTRGENDAVMWCVVYFSSIEEEEEVVAEAAEDFELSLLPDLPFTSILPFTLTPFVEETIWVKYSPPANNCENTGYITFTGSDAWTYLTVTGHSVWPWQWPPCYALSPDGYDVFNVEVEDWQNQSDCSEYHGGYGSIRNQYSNCTDTQTPLILSRLTEHLCSVESGTCDDDYANGCKVAIDYNHDHDFDDPGEEVYVSPDYAYGATTWTGTFVVPQDAVLGETMGRVVCTETYDPSSIPLTGTYGNGETEDYRVIITEEPSCPSPTGIEVDQVTPDCATYHYNKPSECYDNDHYHHKLTSDDDDHGSRVYDCEDRLSSVDPETPDDHYVCEELRSLRSYECEVQTDCGYSGRSIKTDFFWLAMDDTDTIPGYNGGTPVDETGEDGQWHHYIPAPDTQRYNMWFYDNPLDTFNMMKIRMGFWVEPFTAGQPSQISYVVNWSDSSWSDTGFPLPVDESYIWRSRYYEPIEMDTGLQWIERIIYFPFFNPEWVAIGLYGENFIIPEVVTDSLPDGSFLEEYWSPGDPGGIIFHDCASKTSVSPWAAPVTFTTACARVDTFAYVQDFEGQAVAGTTSGCTADGSVPLDDCWKNAPGDDLDWNVRTGSTPSSSTGPSGDHTTGSGKYLYTESSTCYGNEGWIYSPWFDFTGVYPRMSFWYHMYGTTMGTLLVQASTDDGNTWSSDLWSLSGNQGDQWHQAEVSLIDYACLPNVIFRIKGVTGTSYYSDMCIDDISVELITDPTFYITPESRDFGECPINHMSSEYYTQTFTVRNAGPGSLDISDVNIVGADASQFTLADTNSYPRSLSGPDILRVSVTFDPTSTGSKAADLRFQTVARTDNDIPLSGTAVVYPPQSLTGQATITYTNELSWSPPRPEGEIRYDDGSLDSWYWFSSASTQCYFYGRLTTPATGNLDGIAFYTRINSGGPAWYQVIICPDDGSGRPDLSDPGSVIFNDVAVASTTGEWVVLQPVTYALSQDEDFYIVLRYPYSTSGPFIGNDYDNDFGRCAWSNDGGTSWNVVGSSFIMRGYLTTARGPAMVLASGPSLPGPVNIPEIDVLGLTDPGEDPPFSITIPGVYNAAASREFIDYTVHRGETTGTYGTTYTGITATTFTDNTGLIHGQEYFYAITANYSDGQVSDYTNEINLTVPDLPTPPTNPYPADLATNVSPDDSLNWVNNGNVQYVDLFLSMDYDSVNDKTDGTAKKLSNEPVINHYDPEGYLSEESWYWRVIVRDGISTEAEGPVWSFDVADIVAPVITPDLLLPKTASTDPQSVTATITDISGVPSSGSGLPRLFWKTGSAGSWSDVTAGTPTGDLYTFSNFGGGTLGDTIFYYFVARDEAATPNVIADPSAGAGGYSSDPPAAATPPTSPYYYVIVEGYQGSYTLGATRADFTSITGIDGLFDKINNGVVTGDVTVTINSDVAETWFTGLDPITYENASHWDLTVTTSGTYQVTGSHAGGLIQLLGANYVTFDGNSRQLTIENTTSSGTCQVFTLANNSRHNTISQCVIKADTNTSTSYICIYASGSGIDSNSFIGNDLSEAYYGIYLFSSSYYGKGNQITDNTIGSNGTTGNYIGRYGIYCRYQESLEISGNEIFNIFGSTSTPPYGIYLYGANSVEIYGNYIHDLAYTGTSGYGAAGIYLYPGPGQSSPGISMINNVIRRISGASNVPNTSSSQTIPCGIRIYGTGLITGGIDIYHNSIYLERDELYGINYEENDWCAALIIDSGPTGINVSNNVFYNAMGEKTGSTRTSWGYAIYCKSTSSPFGTIDHNIYYSTDFDNNFLGQAGTAQPPANSMDMAAWQVFTGQDSHSWWGDPDFQNDLLELEGGASPAPGGGTPLGAVPLDWDGDARDPGHPTCGAHEYPWQTTWTANSATTDWFGLNNWNTPTLPRINMEVTIPSTPAGGIYFPVIGTGLTGECKSISLQGSAAVTIEGNLHVKEGNP